MNEKVLFLVDVVEPIENRMVKVQVTHLDDTVDTLAVSKYDLQMIDGGKQAWLKVEFSGEKDGLASIEMPAPILNKGKRLTVKTERIKRDGFGFSL
jgi:hypothetical protein